MNPGFRNWLLDQGHQLASVSTRCSSAKRLENAYGDLDSLYDQDELSGVLGELQYSMEDERRGSPNPSKIRIVGKFREGLANYRHVVELYRGFRVSSRALKSNSDAWDQYLGAAARLFEDGSLDRDEGYKADLAAAVSAARQALREGSDNWRDLLKNAVKDGRNNLIDWRDQEKFVRWVDEEADDVRQTLGVMWADGDASSGSRIREFDERLPTELFGKRAKSTRLDCGSYLMMGLDAEQYPPVRLTRFKRTYERLGYPAASAVDLGSEYEHALLFLDEAIEQAKTRGINRPRTRLDAQSVVWSLSHPQSSVDGLEDDGGLAPPKRAAKHVGHGLNTILYGPPGTGKTFSTVRRCVEICDGEAPEDHDQLRARFGALMDKGRVEFVTFHQSYGYEEFVEGLRPVTTSTGDMRLRVEDGILKRIAARAREFPQAGVRRVFKMSLGDPKCWGGSADTSAVFAECVDEGCALLNLGGDIDWSDSQYDGWEPIHGRWRAEQDAGATAHDTVLQAIWRFRTEMRPGDIVVASDGYRHFRGVGEVTGEYEFKKRNDGFHHRRGVRWLWHVRERQGDPVAVFEEGSLQWRPISQMNPANPAGLAPYLGGLDDFGPVRPHVLVIDEINRANISKVLGELITLLEEDKREGAENEVTATLAYSGEKFTLPRSLHILGTMNTADRSIALLDTALRRRFRFEEVLPRPDLLVDAAKRTNVDLPNVLKAMNDRLEYLVDRDHLIGHAWLMNAKTRADVDLVMRQRIIPLLAEYFYDDWSKVCAVLGGTNHFINRQPLAIPPGLDFDGGEERYRWTVRDEFAPDAYGALVNLADSGQAGSE